jgi:hypothetical protein
MQLTNAVLVAISTKEPFYSPLAVKPPDACPEPVFVNDDAVCCLHSALSSEHIVYVPDREVSILLHNRQ